MDSTWTCGQVDCGHVNRIGAAYCEKCGRTPPPPRSMHEAAVRERSRSQLKFYLFIWVPVLIVIALFIIFGG